MSDGRLPEEEQATEEQGNERSEEPEPGEEEAQAAAEEERGPEEELAAARKEAEDYKDRWMRLAAEFDNYKRRTAREMEALVQTANESLMRDLLPIKDSVDRALDHKEDEDSEGYREGLRMIMEEFPKVLREQGLEEIEAVGRPFDPNDHEALMQVPSDEYESGIVTDVVEKGYRLRGRVLRHARVVVSRGPAEPQEAEGKRATRRKHRSS